MSGNYGDIGLGNYMLSIVNSDWITIEAAPGQTPVFSTLYIRSTNKWMFKGVKVQSFIGTNNNNLVPRHSDFDRLTVSRLQLG